MAISRIEQHFGSNIVGCSADGLLPFSRVLDQRSKTEIRNLDVHIGIKKQVAEFQVSMDDLMRVHVVACSNQLNHEEADLRFGKTTTTTEHIHEGTGWAEFERHVHVLSILETVVESHDVGVFERAMDFDFCPKLFEENSTDCTTKTEADRTDLGLGFLGLERGLCDNFTCKSGIARILDFKHACKASLSQEAHTSKLKAVVPVNNDLWRCRRSSFAVLTRQRR